MRNTVPGQQVSSEATLTCQQTTRRGRLDSVVLESLHSLPSDGIRAHHKSVLRPGYRCLNNGHDDEAAVPRLCIVRPEQSRVLRHLTVQSSEKGPNLTGRAYDRSRVWTERARCHPSLVVRDYLRSELGILPHHHSISEPDKRVNHREWQRLHDKSRLEFGRGRLLSANAGQQHGARQRCCRLGSAVSVCFV